MANVNFFVNKIIKLLPAMEGPSGRITLGAKQLEKIAAQDESAAKVLQHLTKGVENPSLNIAYRAQQNYVTAGMRLRGANNQRILTAGMQGRNLGSQEAVIKYQAALHNGEAKPIAVNGFMNGGEIPLAADSAFSISRRGGIITADASSARAFAHHASVDERTAESLIGLMPNGNLAISGYADYMAKIQKQLNGFMGGYRNFAAGELPTRVPNFEKAEKIVGEIY